MIYSIDSDHPKFKKIRFEKGFNIILAERTRQSNQRDSRNGLGKTTMINIIHFCLGGDPKGIINKNNLNEITFVLEIDIAGKKFKLSRKVGNPLHIFVDGNTADWPKKPKQDLVTGKYFIQKTPLREMLGGMMFDLPQGLPAYSPKFGSLISYFIRKQEGYQDPFKHTAMQAMWDVHANNAYLLDLGWKIITEMQILREKQKDLHAFKREITEGKFAGFMGNLGEMEAEKIRLTNNVGSQRLALEKFQINEQYEDIEKTANSITKTIHEKSNQNVADKLLLDKYIVSLEDEKDTDTDTLRKVYNEAGMHFPDNVTHTLKQVEQFHHDIIQNRRDFLQIEIEKMSQSIKENSNDIQKLDFQKSQLMMILNTEGALKEYTLIQKNFNESLSELAEIDAKISNIKEIENKSNQLKIDKEHLYRKIMMDTKEREIQKNKAISMFGDFSKFMYNEFGKLIINTTNSGLDFKVNIRRLSSQGVGNMNVFCYDMTLAKMWSERKTSPGLLIHDSMIFDGVDERQIATALQIAEKTSTNAGFQYICAMNTDVIPKNDLADDFQLDQYVRRTLTDATDDGGIMGIRI